MGFGGGGDVEGAGGCWGKKEGVGFLGFRVLRGGGEELVERSHC